jgi:hypothetical protein
VRPSQATDRPPATRPSSRARERAVAEFIIQTAHRAGIQLDVEEIGDHGADLIVLAPLASTEEAQAACEESFREAIGEHLYAIWQFAREQHHRRRA